MVNTAIFVAAVKTAVAPLSGDAATWFRAIGAFLAFGATVWVATDQAMQKNLVEHNLAVLAAARIAPSMAFFSAGNLPESPVVAH